MTRFHFYNKFITIVIVITISYSLSTHVQSQPPATNTAELSQQHKAIIKNKISFYSNRFKDIQFDLLDGGSDWQAELQGALGLLGKNPVALDYQHPQELRQDLMDVTIKRLGLMLENDIISSTLIRTDQDSTSKQANLCFITLNPEVVVVNNTEATRYMLNYDDELIRKVNSARYLDTRDHLSFLLDHEFFHCLDSFLYGGVPMTHEILGGEYNRFRRESVADAYALSMHLRENGKITNFARNIIHIRALSMFNNSPSHHTFETLGETIRLDIDRLIAMNIMDIISLSKSTMNKTVGSYSDYRNQQAAELVAARALGLEPILSKEALRELEKVSIDTSWVQLLVEHYLYFYKQLFTDNVVNLDVTRLH
jgi:hypothetical protein